MTNDKTCKMGNVYLISRTCSAFYVFEEVRGGRAGEDFYFAFYIL